MANISLAVPPLSRNDISIIANLFEVSFDYYLNHESPFFIEYLRSLRTLVGLGFTATLADKSLLCIYQLYLNPFMKYKEGDFLEIEGAKIAIAQSTAEMVAIAVLCFNALDFPRYYKDFLEALHHTMARIPEQPGQASEVARILNLLKVKRQ